MNEPRAAQDGLVRRPVQPLAYVLVAVMCVLGITALIGVFMDWATAAQEREFAASGSSSTEFYDRTLDHLSGELTQLLVMFAAAVAAAALFGVWMSRVRSNAELISDRPHRLSRGMAVGGFFIPVANMWLGRTALEDVWAASAPTEAERRPGLVRAWWLVALGAFAFSIIGRIASPRPEVTIDVTSGSVAKGLDDVAAAAQLVATMNTFLFLLAAAEAVLTAMIILRISAWQTTGAVRSSQPTRQPPG